MGRTGNPGGVGGARDVTDALRKRGLRATRSRRAVLDVLGRAGARHLGAEALAAEVQRSAPGLHLSTVYRAVDALEAAGLVRHVHLGHGGAAYHLAEPPHAHAVCEACGRVLDVPLQALDDAAARLADQGFRLDPQHHALGGRCAGCEPVPGAH